MKKLNTLLVVLNILIITFTTISIYCILGYFNYRSYSPQPFEKIILEDTTYELKLTKDDMKNKIDKEMKIFYIYTKSSLNDKLLGLACSPLRFIIIDNDIIEQYGEWQYIETLTHELCHIKYNTINETFVEYMTFVELYESKDKVLKDCANWIRYKQCCLRCAYNTEYDCAYYIEKYLEEHIKNENIKEEI